MAICTPQFEMGTFQGEPGLAMVKAPAAPGIRIVASFTAGFVGAVMRVLLSMTAYAAPFRALVALVSMAALTKRQAVHAKQWESGKVVMETPGLQPLAFIVAVFASADVFSMHIVLLVTADAAWFLF